jgi:hypothetical protein
MLISVARGKTAWARKASQQPLLVSARIHPRGLTAVGSIVPPSSSATRSLLPVLVGAGPGLGILLVVGVEGPDEPPMTAFLSSVSGLRLA